MNTSGKKFTGRQLARFVGIYALPPHNRVSDLHIPVPDWKK